MTKNQPQVVPIQIFDSKSFSLLFISHLVTNNKGRLKQVSSFSDDLFKPIHTHELRFQTGYSFLILYSLEKRSFFLPDNLLSSHTEGRYAGKHTKYLSKFLE